MTDRAHLSDTQTFYEIASFITEYQRRLDHDERDNLSEMFAEDVVMDAPNGPIRGRAALAASLKSRAPSAAPVSRHVWSNLRLAPLTDGRVQADMTLTVYHGESGLKLGRMAVLDVTEILVRDQDGRWLFSERRGAPIFRQEL